MLRGVPTQNFTVGIRDVLTRPPCYSVYLHSH